MTIPFSRIIAFVVGFSALASGCGSGHGTATLAPLTDAQKATVKSTVSNITAISSTTDASPAGPQGTAATLTSSSVANEASPSPVSATQPSPTPSEQAQQMISALNQASCTFTPAPPSENFVAGSSFDQKIYGAGCPISMDLNYTSSPVSNGQGSIKFDMEFSVLSDSFRKLNDIDSASLQMSMTYSFNGSVSASASETGKIHSQANGSIGFSAVAHSDGKTVTEDVIYQYSSFKAEIKGTEDVNGNNRSFTINGQPITAAEVDEYVVNDIMANSGSANTSATATTAGN